MVQKTGDLQLPRMLALPRPIKDTGSLTDSDSSRSKGERSVSISRNRARRTEEQPPAWDAETMQRHRESSKQRLTSHAWGTNMYSGGSRNGL
jgi:hypothetical protein